MAIMRECVGCGTTIYCRVSDLPRCDECSGRNEAKRQEAARWAALTVEAKLDELKARLDAMAERSAWDGRLG